MNRIRSKLVQLSPRTKQVLVVVGSAAALFFVIWLFQSEPEKRLVYDKRTDQVANVLTDRSNRNVGLDRMAGQIRRLDRETETVQRDLSILKQSVDELKKDTTLKQLRDQVEMLSGQLAGIEVQQQRALESIDDVRRMRGESKVLPPEPEPAAKEGGKDGKGGAEKTREPSMSISERLRLNREKRMAGDRVNADGTIQGNPFAYESPSAPDAGTPPGKRGAREAAKKEPVRISVVGGLPEEPQTAPAPVEAPEDAVAYIPAGSIITGTILTGGDFPTGRGSYENPLPTLIRIQKEAILPNRFTSDIRECFLLVGGRGELSSERAKLRGEMLSCVRQDGAVIETKLNSYVVGEDGKEGVKGRLVSKQGQMIARTLVAGFASGMSEAFDYDAVPVIQTDSVSNNTLYQQNWSNDAMKGGFAKGASAALERVADFYMDLAEQMVPVVEINAGRQVDVVVINGTRLKVTTEPIVKPGTAK